MGVQAGRRVSIVGRDEALSFARGRLTAGHSVLVHGPPGIGKSTMLAALAEDLARTGDRVLTSTPAQSETNLPYLALIDLLGPVQAEAAELLPVHLHSALDVALLRSGLPASPRDQLAVRLAVLELLRALAVLNSGAVLLVFDDAQWVDAASAEVLVFAARRLGGSAVRVLAAERVGERGEPRYQSLCPPPVEELALGPLNEPDMADLLRSRLTGSHPPSTLRRLYVASAGNPFYALELGRTLRRQGAPLSSTDPLPVPDRLRALLANRLTSLDTTTRTSLVVAAVAARPSVQLLARCGCAEPTAATRTGVIAIEPDGLIRFVHPLLRELVYTDAAADQRREAHRRLGAVVDEPVEQARHLALATPTADAQLAATLDGAAAAALSRGAPATAAELARLAAARTPISAPQAAATRLLTAARHAYRAGLPAQALQAAQAALDSGDRATRVAARLLLVDLAGQDQSGVGPLLDAAFADASGEPSLEAGVRLYRGAKAHYDGASDAALEELRRAERFAERAGDMERLVEALALQGSIAAPLGRPGADNLLTRAARLSRRLELTRPVVTARQLGAMALLFRGDVATATSEIESLRAEVEHEGLVRDLASVLISVTSIHQRAGRCAAALEAGRRCARLFEDLEATPGPGRVVGAGAELAGGSAERAAALADRAIMACRSAGDEEWLVLAFAVRGQADLLLGDPAAAATVMRRARAQEQRLRYVDPAVVPWHADLAEALVAIGALDEAAKLVAELGSYADRLHRHVVLLGLDRVEALRRAAAGEPRAAAEDLRAAIDKHLDHPYPLDLARCYLTLGVLERRGHRRGASRAALAEAADRYAAAGAAPWLALTQAELARLDGARSGRSLSDTERRIVDLVRAGATNREIAASMYLSVKAVEANLTRLYRRHGVRNRTQLIHALEAGQ